MNAPKPGFYKADDGQLLYGPVAVYNATYELHADRHTEYAYPVDGWTWFDSEAEAREALGIPAPEEPQGGAA